MERYLLLTNDAKAFSTTFVVQILTYGYIEIPAGLEMPVGELQKPATDRTKVAGRLFLSFASLQSLERTKRLLWIQRQIFSITVEELSAPTLRSRSVQTRKAWQNNAEILKASLGCLRHLFTLQEVSLVNLPERNGQNGKKKLKYS
jgi:hypothetical protein